MQTKLVLVLNCGSSSLKFALIDADNGDEYLSGLAECLSLVDARIKWKLEGNKNEESLGAGSAHREALDYLQTIIDESGLRDQIVAVGHRVVHGGENFTGSALITPEVIKGIEDCATLAPLHNPAHLIGIRAAKSAFPALPQTAVFDTAFHQSMPQQAYLYALPYKLYRQHGVRRYGMHGTSHLYVSQEAAKMLNKDISETNVIVAHLGNGSSICAVKNGKSIDTSMGMTPLEGLVMGTRCGDIDPAIIFHLVDKLGYTLDEVNTMVHKQSGLLGLTEVSSDCRYVEDNVENGKPDAIRAHDVMCYRLAKYIASYTAALPSLDAIVFTGGIGENSDTVRADVLERLAILGIKVDAEANSAARFGASGVITDDESGVKALVIPTNEEWIIAQDSARLAGV
ncbi:acetate kinase [Echinimonas agarilytica]|uniref:Acetate kinase n=1 Tax=Echinimonas agarilytica TaxID=1215918 RepID=A0AA41W9G9_9GAMM|nr:acetate kinase [Echinimonas agarilytica]MCM2680863.1 acetate kinase [Echinimonas agarilytica]